MTFSVLSEGARRYLLREEYGTDPTDTRGFRTHTSLNLFFGGGGAGRSMSCGVFRFRLNKKRKEKKQPFISPLKPLMVTAPGGNMENISGTHQKPQGRYHGYRHKTPSPTQSPAISPTLHVTLLWRVVLSSRAAVTSATYIMYIMYSVAAGTPHSVLRSYFNDI